MLDESIEYCNTEDPISFETLTDLAPEQVYGLKVGDKYYGFNIDSLFQWTRKTRNSNPITNLPLTDLELAFITDRYLQAHKKDGVISIQVNSSMGWDYGLITIMVGDFAEKTVSDWVPQIMQGIYDAAIHDFNLASPAEWKYIYAGCFINPDTKLGEINGFASGHKLTVS